MDFESKTTSVYTIKAKIISYGSSKSIKTLNRRLHWGRKGIVYQHDPRHVDVLVEDLGFEHVTPCRHQEHLMQQKKKSRNR